VIIPIHAARFHFLKPEEISSGLSELNMAIKTNNL
jgi:hypothetical protein